MQDYLKYVLLIMLLTLGASTAANAYPEWPPHPHPHPYPITPVYPNPRQAPEIDPSMAIAGISLLAGTLTVFRVRRRK